MILISILFLVPIYYIARSKGYNGGLFASAAAILALVATFLPMMIPIPALGILDLALPAATLGVVSLLKTKKGAPGLVYLKITFSCPECGDSVTFPREREGLADLCPKCGELITVPTDQWSQKSAKKNRTKPDGVEGEVCFDDFVREEAAYQLQTMLSGNGVPARVKGEGGASSLLTIQVFSVMIDVKDWDRAVEIERECQQTPACDTASREHG